MSQESTFWRVCNDVGECHCDWRYTIYDCKEETIAIAVYIATAIVSALCTVALAGILYHLQTIRSIIMLTDVLPNTIFRAFFYEFALQFGYHCFACYVFGIAYAISESSRVMYNTWVRSHTLVNILFLCSILCPFFTTTTCAVLAGIYATQGNIVMAGIFTRIQYLAWGFYCGSISLLLLLAGLRLMHLLNKYIDLQQDLRVDTAKVRTGALKVKMIVMTGSFCMGTFALLLALYGGLRDWIMKSEAVNMTVAVMWLFVGPMAALIIIGAILMNPKFANQFNSISFGSAEESDGKKLTSLELGISKDSKNSRASQFLASAVSSPTDAQVKFFKETEPPKVESIDVAACENSRNSAKVEEERCTYNATVGRTRTPPPFYK
ncbi:hypothetical protein INT48_001006 [Thamnidium elegans]|uniref:Uncharacterized protein n=1 Tax=Thamnidium elegans TaxID=101142 RepID=A0A8H7SSZ4_9FUNG|nr:hypothetical protein INT48_001006 [Thamnidium elegans]